MLTTKQLLAKYKTSSPTRCNLNRLTINKTKLGKTTTDVDAFNEVFQWCINTMGKPATYRDDGVEYGKITRTPSGGISKDPEETYINSWGVYLTHARDKAYVKSVELIVLHEEFFARFIVGAEPSNVAGRDAFLAFKRVCKRFGIDLEDYTIDDGKELKKTIKPANIELHGDADKVYDHVHCLDINSAYFYNIGKAYPKLQSAVDNIYANKCEADSELEKAYWKGVLNSTQGYMQSQYCVLNHKGYALANLSKAGVDGTHDQVEDMVEFLSDLGLKVLLTRTDSVWFQCDDPLVLNDLCSQFCGRALGQWKLEHKDCQFRAKSKGAYEFIENGVYTPVVNGADKDALTSLGWGSIYKQEAKMFQFDYNIGFIKEDIQ